MNRLAESLSPYLQQHADNPVDWYPWGPEALAEAERRQVPLFVSVGYAACHWCHVMAHESFEDAEVAARVNELCVPVKVDREERPDVDAVYMNATLALTGQGGWPMTVFATPDGTPFFAGTYFPREHFLRLLDAIDEAWTHKRDDVVAQGNTIVEALAAAGPKLADVTEACPIGEPCPPRPPIAAEVLDEAVAAILRDYDERDGGFGGAPKFPNQPVLAFLQDRFDATGDAEIRKVLHHTANRMARGGMHDQLGGGFARYSVDAQWTVPHFEKMLYDNALLLDTYSSLGSVTDEKSSRMTDEEFFAGVAHGIAQFITHDLLVPEGGFASALDADTDGVEGATYVWTPEQLREVLGQQDGDWAAHLFAVSQTGTFEHGTSVLQLPVSVDAEDEDRFADVTHRLLTARLERSQPQRDDKVVASWNGMAVSALLRFGLRYDEQWAVAAAERAGRLLADEHLVDGRLRRVSRNGVVGEAAGILEDYAAVALAFLDLWKATGVETWLEHAKVLIDVIVDKFTDETGALNDTASDAETLVTRPADLTDGPTPSGWSLAGRALLEYGEATASQEHRDAAWRAVALAEPLLVSHPRFATGIAALALRLLE